MATKSQKQKKLNTLGQPDLLTEGERLPALFPNTGLLVTPDYIPAEVSLETIGYFTPSSKRIKGILTKEKILAEKTNPDGTKTELKVRIIASGEYGLPNTSDLDYYRAFLKILDEIADRDGEIPDPVKIPAKKLIRYAGKTVRAGKKTHTAVEKRSGKQRTITGRDPTIDEVKDWIRRNRHTGIVGYLYNAQKDDYDEVGEEPLFRKYRLRGQRLSDGEIAETNYVWLASWFRINYSRYRRPIDLAFHRCLRKPIAKSLYPLLETGWYASGGKPYEKSYRDLCEEFLLRHERYEADVKRQLDPAHQELKREKFLAKWEYRKAADLQDWVITWSPGPKYFKDQDARKARRELHAQIQRGFTATPQPTDNKWRQDLLVQDILEVTRDPHSKTFYQLVAAKLDEDTVRRAISETKVAFQMGDIRKTRGQYFTDTIKRFAKEQGITLNPKNRRTGGEHP